MEQTILYATPTLESRDRVSGVLSEKVSYRRTRPSSHEDFQPRVEGSHERVNKAITNVSTEERARLSGVLCCRRLCFTTVFPCLGLVGMEEEPYAGRVQPSFVCLFFLHRVQSVVATVPW